MSLFNEIVKVAKRPELYEKGNIKLWEDTHISKGMLEAHLSPDDDAATRNHAFIDASVSWITEIAPPQNYSRLIDLGCGPGMYTSRLSGKGYDVTGVDISKRSIEYAQAQATATNRSIDYRVMNYLELDEQEVYDVAILIYCDYGALSAVERIQILKNAYNALRPGGKLIFDVFTPNQYTGQGEKRAFALYENGGFYKASPHLCLYSHLQFGEHVWLDQYLLVDAEDQIDIINVWDTVFTLESLKREVETVGFTMTEYYSDVAGKPYDETSQTICAVLEKPSL